MAAGTANPSGQPGGFTIAAVRRRDWDGEFDEVLGMKPENVRMRWLNEVIE
jgi:hypothetical protein